MSILRFSRRVVVTVAALSLFAGCEGAQNTIAPTAAAPQRVTISRHEGQSWMLPEANGDNLLYLAARGESYVVSYPDGKLVGTIAGGAQAACSGTNGNVFLVRGNTVAEFAHGSTTPSDILTLPSSLAGGGCSVDAMTGNLAVTYAASNVAVYANATGIPTTYSVSGSAIFCGYDDNGNLFTDGYLGGGYVSLSELPSGGSAFTAISLGSKLAGDPWQVQWDGSYMTIEVNAIKSAIYQIAVAGSSGKVVGTTTFKGFNGGVNQSWIAGHAVIVPVGRKSSGGRTAKLGFWKYPQGGKPTSMFKNLAGKGRESEIYGIAASFAT